MKYSPIFDPKLMKTCIYDKEDKEKLECNGYKRCKYLSPITYIVSICLGGIPFIIFNWKPLWRIKCMYKACCFEDSNCILLKDASGNHFIVLLNSISLKIQSNLLNLLFLQISHGNSEFVNSENHKNGNSNSNSSPHGFIVDNNRNSAKLNHLSKDLMQIYYFDFRFVRYYWNPYSETFMLLNGLDNIMTCDELVQFYSQGLTESEQKERALLYGPNEILVEIKSYLNLLVEEVISPFYVFQVFSVTLWLLDKYFYYASCIILISIISICISLYETKKQSRTIHDMVTRGTSNNISIVIKDPLAQTAFEEHIASPGDTSLNEQQHPLNLKTVHTIDLVPGDVIVIPASGFIMPCDAVLLSGSCIVNESVLTGESIPIIKSSIGNQGCDEEVYDSLVHRKHTLYAGTHILQARPPPGITSYKKREEQERITSLAIVVKTGFSTTKGELVKSIIHPKPLGFEFYKDSMKFVCVLACLACVGMVYSAYILYLRKAPMYRMILRTLDIVTIVVPPSLPAAMTVGTVYSQSRLKKHGIFCISPPRINVCGKIDLACFDKTGTLTEDGLDFWGVVPSDLRLKRFDSFITEPSIDLPRDSILLYTLASCHSLTLINGDVCGDPLELKMFQATNWVLEEPSPDLSQKSSLLPTIVKPVTKEYFMPTPSPVYHDKREDSCTKKTGDFSRERPPSPPINTNEFGVGSKESTESLDAHINIEIGIIRHFSFSSTLQCMSVMVRILGHNHFDLFTKGAPEKILTLCNPATVPPNFNDVLCSYTLKGFRVIALAHRPLDRKLTWHHAQKIKREAFEKDLSFLGFLIMKNALKPATSHVIYELISADIRPVMVTGDNMLTAVSVAHECGMVPYGERVIAVNTIYPTRESHDDGEGNDAECKPEVVFELLESLPPPQVNETHCTTMGVEAPASVSVFEPRKVFRFWDESSGILVNRDDDNYSKGPYLGIDFNREEDLVSIHRSKSAPCAVYKAGTDDGRNGGDIRLINNGATTSAHLINSDKGDNGMDEYTQLISPVYLESGSHIKRRRYHFALTGKSFSSLWQHYPDLLLKILLRGSVFARMAPDQKTLLVESYQKLGYVVSMCGDGANDCGALKAAHAGVSLSEAEASVASPFTSKIQNISCIIRVIREGRCSLVTSFGIFKFMALYSMIQFISVLLLYTIGTNMADRQFLYIDLGIITSLAIFMGRTGPYKNLVRERPPSGLMTFPNLLSIFLQIALQGTFQISALVFLKRQRWYHPPPFPETNSTEIKLCWEVTVVFWVSIFQYLIMAIAFSYDKPFRQTIHSNRLFLLSILSIVSFNTLLLIFPSSMLEQFFTLMPAGKTPHFVFRSIILSLIALNFLASIVLERVIIYLSERSEKFRNCGSAQHVPYLKLQRLLETDSTWPPRCRVGDGDRLGGIDRPPT